MSERCGCGEVALMTGVAGRRDGGWEGGGQSLQGSSLGLPA